MQKPGTQPFKGLLFNTGKAGNIASCVCPPYDVIPDTTPYYLRSPYNAIRLELPQPEPPADPYTTAKATMDIWLRDEILVRDTRDTIYVYEQEFAIEGTSYLRRGYIALNRLDKDRILTHEETRKKAKEDRQKLITTLKAFTSLIFTLYEDSEQRIEDLLMNGQKETIHDFVDDQAVTNRFYRMTNIAEITRLTNLMEEKKIYVADGHHRLDVSYKLGIPYVPLYMTNMHSKGIVVLPYHRVIHFQEAKSLAELLSRMEGYMAIEKVPAGGGDAGLRLLREIASSGKNSYVFYGKEDPGNFYLLSEKRDIPFGGKDVHGSLKNLRVNRLHAGLAKGILGIRDEEISFTQDAHESIGLVKQGSVDAVFLLPPTTVEEVKDIADHGLYMPPKSTFFYPKILTGLVFHTYE